MFQTKKKKVSRRIWKHTEKHRKSNNAYNKRKMDGFNLLKKWVPGTETLSHPYILKKTAKYIQELEQRSPVEKREELEQKIKELEKESEKKETEVYQGTRG